MVAIHALSVDTYTLLFDSQTSGCPMLQVGDISPYFCIYCSDADLVASRTLLALVSAVSIVRR